jgi:predicted acyltransferase
MRALLPVGRSGWAIAAGYLGLFSFLVVPAPLALLTGLLAVRDIKRHPEKHGMGRAGFGIVIGILGTGLLIFLLVSHA